ncbi:hypothetical protein K469DRAFT_699695 [Zopfia rhizophila CBS 207.26]|uniref:Uncharacterized protein n=1 Tax=Zopfia rhizophila CBS 207.26 TaxID=1314779 RepID=A0A6A6EHM5_9PEZI|nr:hypothetical protein K469DRAFT_699695 [Zopfia rhizophila CBS 207.26]
MLPLVSALKAFLLLMAFIQEKEDRNDNDDDNDSDDDADDLSSGSLLPASRDEMSKSEGIVSRELDSSHI